MIGENVFTGDSIFNPDIGSARAAFPGGSATGLFRSTQILLSLPPHYRLYTGHDYPPATRGRQEYATVAEHKERNKHVKSGTTEEEFVKWRSERDATLGEPRLLHQALQFNIRAGRLPKASPEGDIFVRVPVKMPETVAKLMAV
jgi:glyoxylase-like metal-dependent hydrolase (beta-lactamase superfamily II)